MNSRRKIEVLATFFYLGRVPLMPGTVGTLGAIPLVLLFSLTGVYGYIVLTFAFTLYAIRIADQYEQMVQDHDSKEIVIDEVVGFLITMFWLPHTWQAFLIGFILFRALDIIKPYPIGYIDKNATGGFGTASAALEQLEQYRDDYSDSGAQIRAALYSLPHLIDSGDLSGAARECEFLAGELDTPELRAYFLIKAGYLYEEVEETESARRAFNRSYSLLNSDHPARAHARFGEGRALIRLGQREEGRAAIHDVLEMRDVEGLERIQQQAVAYLLRENR